MACPTLTSCLSVVSFWTLLFEDRLRCLSLLGVSFSLFEVVWAGFVRLCFVLSEFCVGPWLVGVCAVFEHRDRLCKVCSLLFTPHTHRASFTYACARSAYTRIVHTRSLTVRARFRARALPSGTSNPLYHTPTQATSLLSPRRRVASGSPAGEPALSGRGSSVGWVCVCGRVCHPWDPHTRA